MLSVFETLLVWTYLISLLGLSILGIHRFIVIGYLLRAGVPIIGGKPESSDDDAGKEATDDPAQLPHVTIQLPIYNELYVAERLLEASAKLDYPADRLEIQVLDDSTDETAERLRAAVTRLQSDNGPRIVYRHRTDRTGFKAGALAEGLTEARGEFVAIFDADFIPQRNWLRRIIPHFQANDQLGMIQTRWHHLNQTSNLLTSLQATYLNGHFGIEHRARQAAGCYFNFNGTAGLWRRQTIDEAGGWLDRTLTEDLDLSYRAQMKGWKFRYLDEVAVPSELPEELAAYRNQQYRWSKGAIEVMRVLGLKIFLHAKTTLLQKFEAFFHLAANFAYLFIFVLSVTLLPMLVVRQRYSIDWIGLADLGVLIFGTVSVGIFYYIVQQREGRGIVESLARLPLLMALGIGLSLNNTRAVLSGLFGFRSPFQRTAKYGSVADASQLPVEKSVETEVREARQSGGGEKMKSPKRLDPMHWVGKSYVSRHGVISTLEIVMFLYCCIALFYTVVEGIWLSIPFVAIFTFGYAICSFYSVRQGLAILSGYRRQRAALALDSLPQVD